MSKTVKTVRKEVAEMAEDWKLIQAAVDGERAVKELGDLVLPRPNAADTSPANQERYRAYLKRAVYYNASGRTLQGLVGYVFSKEPLVTLPETLKVLEENADGAGTGLNQQAKKALSSILSKGRCGLFVDYPNVVQGAATRKDLIDGKVRPVLCLYSPESIINWKTTTVGGQLVVTLVVLEENEETAKDEFDSDVKKRYRVLALQDNVFTVRVFNDQGEQVESYTPADAAGASFATIPFIFLGAEANEPSVDLPPLRDLVTLNLAHFRNSADYEEACYLVGQPTPWVSGLTESWVKEVLHDKVLLGSRAIIPLPAGGQAGLLQAMPNTMPKEAMEAKEKQMVALGAKLVEARDVQRTATEAGLDHASETSILTTAAANVFAAYRRGLAYAGAYVGSAESKVEYDLSEPLTLATLTPEQAQAVLALLQGGAIDFEEARYTLKKAGIAWKDDEEVRENNLEAGFGQPDPNEPDPNAPPKDKPKEEEA